MAMIKTTLAQAIKNAMDVAYTASQDSESNSVQIRNDFANALTDAFDAYIKTMQITVGPGIINVTGTAVAQSNALPVVISNTPPSSIV
jgi:hypothetical protein